MDIQSLFAPLKNKDNCLWFYYLSIIGFTFLGIIVVYGLYIGITSKKSASFYMSLFFISISYFIFYFQSRLLYSMCVKSI